jgi:hypothetical protein
MKALLRLLSICFAAGVVGALANSLAVWASGHSGLTAALGVSLAPTLSLGWLYPRLVWGGLWGLLFALPMSFRSAVVHGAVVGLAPALAQLFVFFPRTGKGTLGLELGALTPLLVVLFDAIWGIAASLWLRTTGR